MKNDFGFCFAVTRVCRSFLPLSSLVFSHRKIRKHQKPLPVIDGRTEVDSNPISSVEIQIRFSSLPETDLDVDIFKTKGMLGSSLMQYERV
jgi:hypothetical protein